MGDAPGVVFDVRALGEKIMSDPDPTDCPFAGLPGFAPRITPSTDAEWKNYYRRETALLQSKLIAKGFECSELRSANKDYEAWLNEIADALGLPHGVTRQKSIVSMILNRIAEISKP